MLFICPVFAQIDLSNVEVKSYHVQGNVWLLQGTGGNVTIQIGNEGVLVVDTQFSETAPMILDEIRRLAPGKVIRYVLNTHAHSDHIGGNQIIKEAGRSFFGTEAIEHEETFGTGAEVIAHENAMLAMATSDPEVPFELWPTDVFIGDQYDFVFNKEAVLLFHYGRAHTNGDVIIFFRKSDVISAGDIYSTLGYPFIDESKFGHINGIIDALNAIIRIAVPVGNQEGGTMIISGHGRIADEADVVEYRDMVTIIRDRIQYLIDQDMSLEEVLEIRPSRDYDRRYGTGSNSPEVFITAIYNGLSE
ncbi:MAG: MBL fold metallo-hydrolase [Pseudohongiellaceae bacterium]